jgi:peptidoglycan pentaglycine glycine transferase (the first glycine)
MVSALNQESWDKKTIELGGSILQSWAWGQFQESLGYKIHRFSGDDFVCLAIETELAAGKKYLYCPRGPLGNKEAALADLKKFSEDRDFVFTRLEPLQPMDLPKATKEIQPSHNWILELDKSEEELLAAMKSKTRYNINLAAKKGVVVKEGNQADLLAFFELMMETAGRNKFRLHPQNYYFQMWDHLAPKNMKLMLAYFEGELVAGLLLTTFAGTSTYLHGGSTQKHKEIMAPYLLHWEAVRLAKNSGCTAYDFGGIAPTDDPADKWAGITRFKKSFGGLEVVYPGAYDLIYSPIWYTVYKQARELRNILSF